MKLLFFFSIWKELNGRCIFPVVYSNSYSFGYLKRKVVKIWRWVWILLLYQNIFISFWIIRIAALGYTRSRIAKLSRWRKNHLKILILFLLFFGFNIYYVPCRTFVSYFLSHHEQKWTPRLFQIAREKFRNLFISIIPIVSVVI